MKLTQQLALTPQLQMAIQLLSKPHAEAVALLREKATGLRELSADEVDPLDALELAEAKDGAREPWLWQRLPMLPAGRSARGRRVAHRNAAGRDRERKRAALLRRRVHVT